MRPYRGKTKDRVSPNYMPPRFLDEGEIYNVPPMIEGEWVAGQLFEETMKDGTKKPFIIEDGWVSVDNDVYEYEIHGEIYEVVPETVGQSTGLKDKANEKDELYHNDIVLVGSRYIGDYLIEQQNGIVEWVEDGWSIVDLGGEYICGLFDYVYNNCGGKLGNIHDNPDLKTK